MPNVAMGKAVGRSLSLSVLASGSLLWENSAWAIEDLPTEVGAIATSQDEDMNLMEQVTVF
ncbi:hypothetical protein C7B65_00770 [Phormidesmis priestleyi ULC007]|uniref:Uncharacterized protein n=2 Tax=Phormidesmis priestleyi TaxID=268141 RepID=A0A2T1DND9_9CYAN|nr:hypothetical protein C7B65_00770 [Phormidesmis priestleyi ULC007]PZO55050.1 MAG: hypothetical protein DCF14_00805 [Phormidesmis priestleyi]